MLGLDDGQGVRRCVLAVLDCADAMQAELLVFFTLQVEAVDVLIVVKEVNWDDITVPYLPLA